MGGTLSRHGRGADTYADGVTPRHGNPVPVLCCCPVGVRLRAAAQPPAVVAAWGLGSGPGEFDTPTGIAVDASGHVYVADFNNNRVQKFDGDGNYLTQWGSFGGGDGEFWSPNGIAVGAGGEVYVTDYYQCRVEKFDSNGAYLSQWGLAGNADGQFLRATAIAVGSAGNLFVTDWASSRIQKFDGAGVFLAHWGSVGSAPGQFRHVIGVAWTPRATCSPPTPTPPRAEVQQWRRLHRPVG
jgi:hypothetical protein